MGSYNIKSVDCNRATLADRLEDTVDAVLQAGINSELGYGRNDIKKVNMLNDFSHRISKIDYVGIQDDEPNDHNGCLIDFGYQREFQELERKIIFMFAEGMSTRDISEYIQSLFELDAQEYFVNSSK